MCENSDGGKCLADTPIQNLTSMNDIQATMVSCEGLEDDDQQLVKAIVRILQERRIVALGRSR